eukprot:m.120571 g.120571  ORF g.120571 m.120571 type:complete len:111 (+) comp11060_c0_seq4:253-585(+)
MRDLESTSSERSQTERKRRRVFEDAASSGPPEAGTGPGRRRGKRKGVRSGVLREASAALRLPLEAPKPGTAAERLASWEIDQDIRAMVKNSSTRGRNARPPAKLKDAAEL